MVARRLAAAHKVRLVEEAKQITMLRRTILASYRAELAAAIKTAAKNGGSIWSWQIAQRARLRLESAGLAFGRQLSAAIVDASERQLVVGAEAFVGRIVGRAVELPGLRRTFFSFRHDIGAFTGRDLARHAQLLSAKGAVDGKSVAEVEREIVSGATKRAANLAERVISTETTRAQVDGALMIASTLGIGLRWDATIDARTCTQCAAMHGRVVTPRDERPPLHPRCRCILAPEFVLADAGWTDAELEEIAAEMNEPRTKSGFPWWILLALALKKNRQENTQEELALPE